MKLDQPIAGYVVRTYNSCATMLCVNQQRVMSFFLSCSLSLTYIVCCSKSDRTAKSRAFSCLPLMFSDSTLAVYLELHSVTPKLIHSAELPPKEAANTIRIRIVRPLDTTRSVQLVTSISIVVHTGGQAGICWEGLANAREYQ